MRQLNSIALHASDAASANGIQVDSNQLISASFQAVFGDSTASGTVAIQASNDVSQSNNNFVVTNWTNISNASATVTDGQTVLIAINPIGYRWIRAVWTHSSGGSSTITISMFAQSL